MIDRSQQGKGPLWPKPRPGKWFLGANHIGDYMHRWILETPWFTIRLHHILRSDEDRALHDHPWDFVSLILWGGYTEVTQWYSPKGVDGLSGPRYDYFYRRFGPGNIIRRKASDLHRLELPEGKTAWTLVFTGPTLRSWGFHIPFEGWIPWKAAKALWAGEPIPEEDR